MCINDEPQVLAQILSIFKPLEITVDVQRSPLDRDSLYSVLATESAPNRGHRRVRTCLRRSTASPASSAILPSGRKKAKKAPRPKRAGKGQGGGGGKGGGKGTVKKDGKKKDGVEEDPGEDG